MQSANVLEMMQTGFCLGKNEPTVFEIRLGSNGLGSEELGSTRRIGFATCGTRLQLKHNNPKSYLAISLNHFFSFTLLVPFRLLDGLLLVLVHREVEVGGWGVLWVSEEFRWKVR